ncbi:MAG: FAD-dependent thymidylate synthase [Nitrospiria bacterium]
MKEKIKKKTKMQYSEEEIKNINELRRQLGTLPEQIPTLDIETIEKLADDPLSWEENENGIKVGPFQFYEGVRNLRAELIDCTRNPYQLLYEMAVATWGSEEYPTMWPLASPENRFYVVKNVLAGKALPLGTETINFTFIIRGASRAAFDQHARQRLGATFASQGVRDNSRLLSGIRVPNEIWRDAEKRKMFIRHAIDAKIVYYKLVTGGEGNSYQAARSVFQMSWTHNYKYSVNLEAMKGYMARRLVASEQEDTVATAIAIWNEVNKKFPMIANVLRPKCDRAGKCLCHQGGGDAIFGALFRGCGRFPESEGNYASFNWACSDYNVLEEQSGIHLPWPKEWKNYDTLESIAESDRKLFEEGYTV